MTAKTWKRPTYREDWIKLGRWLDAKAKENGIATHAAFAKRAGVSKTMVSHVFSGRVAIPMDRIDAWALRLDLSPRELRAFRKDAWLCHSPPQIRELLEDLEGRLKASRRMVASLSGELPVHLATGNRSRAR